MFQHAAMSILTFRCFRFGLVCGQESVEFVMTSSLCLNLWSLKYTADYVLYALWNVNEDRLNSQRVRDEVFTTWGYRLDYQPRTLYPNSTERRKSSLLWGSVRQNCAPQIGASGGNQTARAINSISGNLLDAAVFRLLSSRLTGFFFFLHFLHQLSKLAESGSDRLECANVDLKADIERWHKNKRTDWRDLFTEYSERHINYYQEVRVLSS